MAQKKTSTVLEEHGWKVLGEIGKGGQAAVLKVRKATDPADGPSYACKPLRSEEGTQAYERFHREIESLKKLNHLGIIKVVDHQSDYDEGIHFYVMEYVPGAMPLKKLVGTPNNPFYGDAIGALGIYTQIVEALVACERANIIHRDLSLGNILITPERTIKLIDFGCCHIDDGRCITLTDEGVGTPNYRAPECDASSNEPPTIRADLYSAGKILWLKGANRIRTIIEKGYPPLELLAEETCPICGVGKFTAPKTFLMQTLIGSNHLKPNEEDSEIAFEIKQTGINSSQDVHNLPVCMNCGFMAKFLRSIPKKLLRLRTELEWQLHCWKQGSGQAVASRQTKVCKPGRANSAGVPAGEACVNAGSV